MPQSRHCWFTFRFLSSVLLDVRRSGPPGAARADREPTSALFRSTTCHGADRAILLKQTPHSQERLGRQEVFARQHKVTGIQYVPAFSCCPGPRTRCARTFHSVFSALPRERHIRPLCGSRAGSYRTTSISGARSSPASAVGSAAGAPDGSRPIAPLVVQATVGSRLGDMHRRAPGDVPCRPARRLPEPADHS